MLGSATLFRGVNTVEGGDGFFFPLNQVVLGDALEVLRRMPSESVDLGATSPPYNKGEKNDGRLVPKVVYQGFRDSLPEEECQHYQVAVLNELYRVTKEGGSFFYNHKVRYEGGRALHPVEWLTRTEWNLWQEIIWNRRLAGNIRGWRFWQVDERVYWLVKGKPRELAPRHARLSSVWELRPESGHGEHPAVFPLELPARIIHSLLEDRQGVVIDPFCGTGTTLVAAKLLGKGYIGIEISERYVAYARDRLAKAEEERGRVARGLARHQFQEPLFREEG